MEKRKVRRKKKNVAGAVNDAIERILGEMGEGGLSGARLTELTKLLQLRKELGGEQPKNINVRWIETWESTPSNET